MRQWTPDDDEGDDDIEDPSRVEQDSIEDEQAAGFGTVPCPYCGESISDFAELCPHCQSYISREDMPADRKPKWVILVTVLLLIALTLGVVAFR